MAVPLVASGIEIRVTSQARESRDFVSGHPYVTMGRV